MSEIEKIFCSIILCVSGRQRPGSLYKRTNDKGGFFNLMEKLFHLKEKGTNVKTEIIAGITTFLAMAYILAVNPMILGDAGMKPEAVFMATALSSAAACLLMGLLANYPVALSAGMGVNALFSYTVVLTMGYSWQAALAAVFISGLVFVLISVTGIRKKIIDSIPVQLKLAIGAGIGFFIAFVGLIITAVIGVILGLCGVDGMPAINGVLTTNFDMSAAGAFASGFGELFSHPMNALVVIFSFLFVDFFDTAGTLVAIGNEIGLVKENGELENAEQALLADSIGTCIGAALGTSTVTSFVESSSGVGVGGRTGLTAVTTGVLFILSIFISPLILGMITNAVTAPALVVVGVMMAQQLKGIQWDDLTIAIPAFITIISMILMYSISNGIAFGFIAYAVCMVAAGKIREIHPTVWILMVIFVIYFASPYLMA